MDSHLVEGADVFESRDASGGGDLEIGRGAQAAEPVEVGALHHAFFIHVGAEEAGAIRLQLLDDFFGGEARGFLPAFHHDAAVFRIERKHDALAADGVDERLAGTRSSGRRR